ncbi:52 kDa repressor of the inhibitor of the protein kinase isoform X2 [Microcaecilia unicolor]|uniref:52 kDa repressor of the inhibitor of the protein kinase isoform X2 n=1 Tax=Microcaecilia unicolor TaxID=1415580 RepID=A0A6P7XPX1_9AMPH|nr:52 kDa repressor of the inhibitor of the protein kinase isoform X2 [Microcaecilia unicolor]
MPNYCAALNCSRKSTHSDIGFFRFPRDPARCKQWVENCQRVDLEDKTADHLNKCYRLCARHFDSSMVRRKSPYRTRLQDNAVPTIFDFRSHLTSPQSRRKRRIKEPDEEEEEEEDLYSPISQWESPEMEPASDDEESALIPFENVQRWIVRPDFSQNSMVLYLDLKQIPDGGMQSGGWDHLETVKEEKFLEEDYVIMQVQC